jgi:hypothetical protein
VSRKQTGVFKVYFEDNGDMKRRLSYWDRTDPARLAAIKSEDNHVWHDRLEYVDYYTSAMIFKSLDSGRKYYMFLRHFDEMMKAKVMNHGVIEGDFTFTKRGQIQGFKMILPAP